MLMYPLFPARQLDGHHVNPMAGEHRSPGAISRCAATCERKTKHRSHGFWLRRSLRVPQTRLGKRVKDVGHDQRVRGGRGDSIVVAAVLKILPGPRIIYGDTCPDTARGV